MKKSLLLIISALILSFTAQAKVTTISPNAENDALRLAVHYAEDGDIIEMTEGTYVQCNNGYVAFDGKSVTVKAAEGANVVLQLQVPITLTNGGKATLQGIKIDASRLTELANWYEHVIYASDTTGGKELVMDGCELYGFNINKSAIYSSSSNTLALCDVKNCYFHDNMKSCFFFEGASIAELSVVNSTFANIATDASGYYAGIIDVRNAAAKVTVDHCTFYNCLIMNTDHAAITMKGPQAANVVISNNIFMLPEAIDGHRAIKDNVEATNCMTFNYVKDNGGIHSSVTKTNCFLNVDPKFVNAANGNFALADDSPALGAGTDGSNLGDPRWNAPAEEEKPVEIVGVVKRALQIGESTVVLTHEADGTPHIYNIIDEEIAEVSQEGVIARDPENPGDHLAISDIVATEDGKLVACNYTRCNYNDGTVETGYKRGTTYVYKWEDLTAAPSVWFTSQYASNSNKSDQGYTIALNGSSTNCQILMSGVHRYGNGVRFTIFDVVDNEVSESFFGYQLGVGVDELAIFDEAYDGTNFQLSVSPRNEKEDYIMDAEKMAPVEFETAGVNEEPVVLGELDEALVGVKFNGVTYLTIGEQAIMVAPYADAEGQLVGVKVLDITAGLDAATVLKVADLDAPVAATAAATAVAVTEDELIITLVGDATLYTLTVKLTQEPGPGTALENIAVEGKAVKAIINGQLIIVKDGVKFNALGQVIK